MSRAYLICSVLHRTLSPGGQSELVARESVVVLLQVTVSSTIVVAIGMKKSTSYVVHGGDNLTAEVLYKHWTSRMLCDHGS